jgi:hypothetical protein
VAREIAIDRFGGPEILHARVVPDTAPGPGEAHIRQTAIDASTLISPTCTAGVAMTCPPRFSPETRRSVPW